MPLTGRLARALVLGCALASIARGAHAETHVIGANVALGVSSAREDLLVPIAFTGPGLALGARYALGVASERLEAELSVGAGLVLDRFGNAGLHLPYGAALGYAHVVQHSSASSTRLGALLRWQTELSYLEAWDDAHGYWLAALALAPALRHAYVLAPNMALETRAELALFGVAARPPSYRANKQDALPHASFYVDRLQDGEAFWLLDVQLARLELLLRRRPSGAAFGSGFGLGPFVRFARASEPEPYAALYAGLLIDYGWQL